MTTTAPHRRTRSRRGSGGELRAEILAAARALAVTASTPSEVSLRAVAEAVGVSVMSIYHHFADKQALIEAIVDEDVDDLITVVIAAASGVEDPLESLLAQGAAYVRFAVDRPGRYCYATMERHRGGSEKDTRDRLGDSIHKLFTTGVIECIDAGILPSADPVTLSLELWTAAHGLATALITQPNLPWGDPATFAHRVLRSVALGHSSTS